MKNVIITGDCGERALTRAVVSACTRYGGTVVSTGRHIFSTGKDPEYLILSVDSPAEIMLPESIIVAGRKTSRNALKNCPDDCTIVIDTGSSNSVSAAVDSGCPVVGCSMSAKDTLSISGSDRGFSFVTLSREIKHAGILTEPHDVRVHSDFPAYPLLAACAVLMISGNINTELCF